MEFLRTTCRAEGSIVCHEAGIVEPITLSLLRFLSSEDDRAEDWIEEAVQRKSLPLLARVDIALTGVKRALSS